MNTVNYKIYNKAYKELQDQVYDLYAEDRDNNPGINVLYISVTNNCSDNDRVNLRINWACSNSPLEVNATELFVKRLNKIIEMVNNFPYNGYKIV